MEKNKLAKWLELNGDIIAYGGFVVLLIILSIAVLIRV